MTYSQNHEDALAAPLLPLRGRLLDIGACDGVRYSNTRRFMEAGWTGVLIEADRTNFDALAALYADYPGATTIHRAVVPSAYPSCTVAFTPATMPGIGSCLGLWPEHRDKWGAHCFRHTVQVPVLRPADIMSLGPFDLVSLDIEGGNLDLATEFDWPTLCTAVAIVEHDQHVRHLQKIFGSAFRLAHLNGENAIFVRNRD
jgi:hypothetical protein